MTEALSRARVILKDTTHPGNIGATARAMKTMGLGRLYLVSPRTLIDSQSRAMSAGALDILENAIICETLAEAIAECTHIFAYTARKRELAPPLVDAKTAGQKAAAALSAAGEVAFLFGGERSGLDNEDARAASFIVEIPANPEYSSMNLSQATQIAVYELRQALLAMHPPANTALASMPTQKQLAELAEHAKVVLTKIDMPKRGNRRLFLSRLVRIIKRAAPEESEVRMLRGLLKAVEKVAKPPKSD